MDESKLQALAAQLPGAPIAQIADIIRRDWKPMNYAAVPYVQAMLTLPTIESSYGADDGKGIVLYFLSNASTWRGPVAKLVKAELKKRVGVK